MTCRRAPGLLLLGGWLLSLQGCEAPAPKLPKPVASTRVHLRVLDADTRKPVPALVTFLDPRGGPIGFGNLIDRPGWGQGVSAGLLGSGALGYAHGMALWRGEAVIPIGVPFRHLDSFGQTAVEEVLEPRVYRVQVSRGPEYDLVDAEIDARAGRGDVEAEIVIRRTVDTDGYIAADLHVHSAPASPDGGARLEDQIRLAAASGLELLGTAEHDHALDAQHLVAQLWQAGRAPLSTLTGMEVGGPMGAHFALMFAKAPASRDFIAQFRALSPGDPAQWMAATKALPAAPMLMMVHPRLGWGGYLTSSSCGPWAQQDRSHGPACAQGYDVLEVMYGWSTCGSKQHEAVDDWYALLNLGMVAAAVGNSDSHHLTGIPVGMPRSYLRLDDDQPGKISGEDVIAALRARRTIVSTGPFVTLSLGGAHEGDLVALPPGRSLLRVRVQAPNWIDVEQVRLVRDGVVVTTWKVSRPAGRELDVTFEHPLGGVKQDAFYTVEALGTKPMPAYLVGIYNYLPNWGLEKCPPQAGQPPGTLPFAVSSPLFIDANRDGRFTGSRATRAVRLPG